MKKEKGLINRVKGRILKIMGFVFDEDIGDLDAGYFRCYHSLMPHVKFDFSAVSNEGVSIAIYHRGYEDGVRKCQEDIKNALGLEISK